MSELLGSEIPEHLARLDNAEEEIVPLPRGGDDPAKIEADLKRAERDRNRILHKPATADEREAQRLYTEALTTRAEAVGYDGMPQRHRRLVTAAIHERAAREMLAGLKKQKDAPDYEERKRHASLGLAMALYQQGRFAEALRACPKDATDERRQIERVKRADLVADESMCTCADIETTPLVEVAGQPARREKVTIPAHTPIGEFPSVRRNCWCVLIECSICGAINLRKDLTESAARVVRARASKHADHLALR